MIRKIGDVLKEKYGCKVYKIALNGGFTCPNRDGTCGSRGCIFCSEGGSGEFAQDPALSIHEQIESGKKLIEPKLNGQKCKYIAYFQAYTGTYAPVDKLRKLYAEAISHPDIEILSIATRPDCLDDDVLGLLEEMNRIKPVWIELGLQTIHEKTADYIRRGYPLNVYDCATEELTKRGIEVITHVIIGLPGETKEDILKTVNHVCKSGAHGIKLQLLHILKDTDISREYEEGRIKVLTEDEYIDILSDCLKIIPESVIIHRLTGDGDKRLLLAPMWSADKKHVLNRINNEVLL
ncbi:MAG: TIGR01212 family radical SAM protein [Lachnospiraceae bacterium]|nr:TIGR01212 family radical SAM protein [Lachnospiraceae bacterium]